MRKYIYSIMLVFIMCPQFGFSYRMSYQEALKVKSKKNKKAVTPLCRNQCQTYTLDTSAAQIAEEIGEKAFLSACAEGCVESVLDHIIEGAQDMAKKNYPETLNVCKGKYKAIPGITKKQISDYSKECADKQTKESVEILVKEGIKEASKAGEKNPEKKVKRKV